MFAKALYLNIQIKIQSDLIGNYKLTQMYSKFQSSWEAHRNYMTFFRHDASWSSLYALQENVFMRIADDKDKTKTEGVYKMLKKEKELLDTFMYSVNTGLLLNKGNIDLNGKATIHDPDTNRPIDFQSLAA